MLGAPRPFTREPSHWVYEQWTLEFYLAIGWIVVTVLLEPPILILTIVADAWKGNAGNQIGVDASIAIVSFALTGAVVHLVHMSSLRIYWILNSRPRSARPTPWTPVSPPPAGLRHFLASTPIDLLVQLIVGVVDLAIALHLNP